MKTKLSTQCAMLLLCAIRIAYTQLQRKKTMSYEQDNWWPKYISSSSQLILILLMNNIPFEVIIGW